MHWVADIWLADEKCEKEVGEKLEPCEPNKVGGDEYGRMGGEWDDVQHQKGGNYMGDSKIFRQYKNLVIHTWQMDADTVHVRFRGISYPTM